MRKHDHGQIPMSSYSKIKLKTRSLFKNGSSIKLNGQDGKGDLQSRQDLNSNSLDLDGSNLNDDEDKQGRLARSVEDDDEIEDYDDEDEDDEEDEDLDDEDDEDYDEDESEELAKSVENKKVLVQSN